MTEKQRSAERYIHKPDRHEAEGDELFCIYHDERYCNAACVAFDIHGAQDEQRTPCILVNAQMQQAAALVKLVKLVGSGKGDVPGRNIPPPGV